MTGKNWVKKSCFVVLIIISEITNHKDESASYIAGMMVAGRGARIKLILPATYNFWQLRLKNKHGDYPMTRAKNNMLHLILPLLCDVKTQVLRTPTFPTSILCAADFKDLIAPVCLYQYTCLGRNSVSRLLSAHPLISGILVCFMIFYGS